MVMVDFLPLIVVGFAASLGLTPLTRQLATRFGFMDKPNPRKVHRTPIPFGGGLAIYAAFLIALLLFNNWPKHLVELGVILIGSTWLALVGMLDDRLELSPAKKFGAQFIAGFLVIVSGIRVELFGNVALDSLLTFVWVVGIVNAINFLDNMDGLAAGISAICALFTFLLAFTQGQELVSALAAALGGSAIGFLIYNFNPATTFMGDMGSMVLGFVLAVLGIKLRFPLQHLEVSWMIPILVLGLPIFDTTLVVVTRLMEKRSPFQGAKDHTSHRLVALGLSQRTAVIVLYITCILLGAAAMFISVTAVPTAYMVGLAAAFIGGIGFVFFIVIRQRQPQQQ
jgi:UDP-GlcNAc:undecaprenyl-phosphate/decaprenyl-phosphate GlcNAc-1-phosphate transferase